MGTLASELKAEREKRKIPLAHIAAETRISLRHLESLEEGRYEDMPGGIYNRAFLKAYSEFLNLNIAEIMQRYENEVSLTSEKSSRTRAHMPKSGSSFGISPIFVWSLMLALSVTGLYFSRKWITSVFSPYFSHAPASPVRYEPVQPPAPKAQPIPPAVTDSSAQAALPVEAAAASHQLPPTAADSPPSPPTSQPINPVVLPATQIAGPLLRLEVTATEKCWVSIEKDGISVFRKNMMPGEMQSFDAADKFLLIVGNAGGVQLRLNGKPARLLGKPGEVVRLRIDRDNLQNFLDHTAG